MKKSPDDRLWTGQYTLTLLTNFSVFMVHFILLVSIPLYLTELGAGSSAAGLSTGLYSLAALLIRPIIGHFLDHRGRLRLLRAGMIPVTLGIILSTFSDSLTVQLTARVIEGFGFSILSTTGATIVSDLVSGKRFAEGIGYNAMIVTVTNSLGPLAGLTIISALGYDLMFLILVPMSLIPLVITIFLKESGAEDVSGTPPMHWSHFFTIEKNAVPASLLMVFASISFGAVISFLAAYGIEQGIGNMQFFFLLYPAAVLASRLFIGRLIDRLGFAPVVLPSLFLAGTALLLIYFSSSKSLFALAALFYGVGYGTLLPAYMALAIQNSPVERRGAANATFYIAQDLGVGGGSILLGFIAGAAGLGSVFLLSAIMLFISLILFPRLGLKLQKCKSEVSF